MIYYLKSQDIPKIFWKNATFIFLNIQYGTLFTLIYNMVLILHVQVIRGMEFTELSASTHSPTLWLKKEKDSLELSKQRRGRSSLTLPRQILGKFYGTFKTVVGENFINTINGSKRGLL